MIKGFRLSAQPLLFGGYEHGPQVPSCVFSGFRVGISPFVSRRKRSADGIPCGSDVSEFESCKTDDGLISDRPVKAPARPRSGAEGLRARAGRPEGFKKRTKGSGKNA